jgi:hypothetical protein
MLYILLAHDDLQLMVICPIIKGVSSTTYFLSSVTYHVAHSGTRFRRAQKIPSTRFQKIAYNVDILIGKVVQSNLEHIKQGMMRCYLEFA